MRGPRRLFLSVNTSRQYPFWGTREAATIKQLYAGGKKIREAFYIFLEVFLVVSKSQWHIWHCFASVPISSTAASSWRHLLLFSHVSSFEFLTLHSNEQHCKVLEKTRIMLLQHLKCSQHGWAEGMGVGSTVFCIIQYSLWGCGVWWCSWAPITRASHTCISRWISLTVVHKVWCCSPVIKIRGKGRGWLSFQLH